MLVGQLRLGNARELMFLTWSLKLSVVPSTNQARLCPFGLSDPTGPDGTLKLASLLVSLKKSRREGTGVCSRSDPSVQQYMYFTRFLGMCFNDIPTTTTTTPPIISDGVEVVAVVEVGGPEATLLLGRVATLLDATPSVLLAVILLAPDDQLAEGLRQLPHLPGEL